MARKVIITAALTGAFHGKSSNPNLPEQPNEIIQSAYECYNAGASIVHIHARDKAGNSSNDPNIFAEINAGIRTKCSIIIQNSTAPAVKPGAEADDGVALLYDSSIKGALPEMCSLDTSLISTAWGELSFIYRWERLWLIKQAKRMMELGIKPELEVFNSTSIEDIFASLVPNGVLSDPVSITFVMGMNKVSQGAIAYTQKNHDFMISMLPNDRFISWTTMAIAANQLMGVTYGVLKGGNARVGMEDNIYYAHGRLAKSNAELVERMVRIIHEIGLEVAIPDEARSILGIPPLSISGK